MISKIRRKTSDLKLKYKLVLIYCFTGFIPVLIIFLVSLYLMRGVLRENSTENINSYLYQEKSRYMTICRATSRLTSQSRRCLITITNLYIICMTSLLR